MLPREDASPGGLLPGRTPPREHSSKAGGRKFPKPASQNRPSSVREGGWPGRAGSGRAGSGRAGTIRLFGLILNKERFAPKELPVV